MLNHPRIKWLILLEAGGIPKVMKSKLISISVITPSAMIGSLWLIISTSLKEPIYIPAHIDPYVYILCRVYMYVTLRCVSNIQKKTLYFHGERKCWHTPR